MALLLATIMLGLAVRLYALDGDGLWIDELRNATISQLDLLTIPGHLAATDCHPPLLFVVTKLATALWGNSDFVVRLPAALLGAASILLAYKAGALIWGRCEGLIGAFLLSINVYHISYSQEARNYSPMVFLALLSLIFLLLALKRGRKRWWFLFAVCASLNLYTHDSAFLVLASEALFAAWVVGEGWHSSMHRPVQARLESKATPDSEHQPLASGDLSSPSTGKQAYHLVAALVLVGLLYLPWLPSLWQQLRGPIIQFEGLGVEGVPRARLSMEFFGGTWQAYTGVGGVLLLLFLALFALGMARSQRRHVVLFGSWVAGPFLFVLSVRAGWPFAPKYAIFVVPLFLLCVARGVSIVTTWLTSRLPLIRERQVRSLALASAITVSVFGSLSVAPIRAYYTAEKTDYRGVASYLQQKLERGDAILADGIMYHTGQDSAWTGTCLSYYMSPQRLKETPVLSVERGLWSDLQNAASPQGEVVAVLARRFRPGFWGQQTDVDVVDFEDLSIIYLRRPTGDVSQDSLAMLEALTRLLRMPDAQFDVRLALAEGYAATGRELDAASQIVLASMVLPDDESAIRDLEAARSQLRPSLDVQLVEMTLGDSLFLPGYSLSPISVRAGDAVVVTLWWRTTARMERDYSAFLHIIAPYGLVAAQEDRLLLSRDRPTSRWHAGELVADEYLLVLPQDAEPGQYVVITGAYLWETGERLPVRDAEGQRVADDAITLGTISVGK